MTDQDIYSLSFNVDALGTMVKSTTSPAGYFGASMRVESFGHLGAKPRPFSLEAAVRHFYGWAYAATMINANAVASVPLRLYAFKRPGYKSSHEFATKAEWKDQRDRGAKVLAVETRPLPKNRRKYLLGQDKANSPAAVVVRKAAEFGGEVEEVTGRHAIMSVLREVNRFQNGYTFSVARIADLQWAGNCYIHVVLGSVGVPAELWRMPPQWVKIIATKANYIEGYVYGKGTDVERTFAVDEVIHSSLYNPHDLHYGMGYTQAAWTALGLNNSKREVDLAKFDNYCRPEFLFSVPGANANSVQRFKDEVESIAGGTHNAGKHLVVGADAKAIPLQQPVDETGTADRVLEEIAAVWGVPVAMLKTNDPNRANSESARLMWHRNGIKPLCKNDEENLNQRLVPQFDGAEEMFLAYDSVSFEDETALRKNAIGAVAGGVLTVNEGRSEIGYDAHDDGDVLYPPSGVSGDANAMAGDLAVGQNDRRRNEDE